MNEQQLKMILEGALLAAGRPLTLDDLLGLFDDSERPECDALRNALNALAQDYNERSFELREVASGFRVQVKRELSPWISRLWMERPSRYSRALLETMALVAYRQPITRGEIEDIRGVSVSSSIMKTLQEREWIRVVGHRDVPGKPAMYGTTKQFLDYFDLKSLDELPTLAELRDIDSINAELDLRAPGESNPEPEHPASAAFGPESGEESASPSETQPEPHTEEPLHHSVEDSDAEDQGQAEAPAIEVQAAQPVVQGATPNAPSLDADEPDADRVADAAQFEHGEDSGDHEDGAAQAVAGDQDVADPTPTNLEHDAIQVESADDDSDSDSDSDPGSQRRRENG